MKLFKLGLLRRNRATVRVKSVRASSTAEGGYLYELEPTNYAGPWRLSQGEVLEVKGRGVTS